LKHGGGNKTEREKLSVNLNLFYKNIEINYYRKI